MKLYYYWIVLSIIFCISCGDDNKSAITYISLETSEITFEPVGGNITLTIETDGVWQASNIPDWISLNYTSGNASKNKIIVTALSNENTEQRDAEIYFLRENQKAILKIHQLNKEKELTWSSLNFSFFNDVSFNTVGNERIYSFTATQLFINPDASTDIEEKIFLGNLVNRNLETNINVSVYKGYTFNPITVSSSSLLEKSQTFIPSKLEQDSYANKILAKKPTQSESFISNGEGAVYHTHKELNLIGESNMGLSLDKIVSEKSYLEQEMTKANGLIYSFSHTLFTLDMDLQEDIIKETLNKKDFPENSISFISSVSYGRIGLLVLESNSDISKIRTVVNKILRNNIDNITQEEYSILDELNAYHIYYNESQKRIVTKGKIDVIKAYKSQMTDDVYNVFPFRFSISDYFDLGTANLSFKMILP